ncbi:MAG: hypothetical protein M3Q10_03220 [Chloroflexota bacterium]|nr:hypothetical protein [Chloroflexota bacterium]
MNPERVRRRRGNGAVPDDGAAGAVFRTWEGEHEVVTDDSQSGGLRHPELTASTQGVGTTAAVARAIARREAVR